MRDRYVFASSPQEVAERFALGSVPPDLPTRYNVAPRMHVPIVVGSGPSRLDIMRWGLVPSWAKDERAGARLIHAHAETVAAHPAYRAALRYHRCLVPANGYYVWRATGHGKEPYFVHLRDEPLFAFAGLYAVWYSPDGTELRTYTILTCAPNSLIVPTQSRMPVILPRAAEAAWLDSRETRAAAVLPLLQPYPREGMAARAVSTAVNNRKNEGPGLIAPLPAHDPPAPRRHMGW